jgi:Tol biopolymer transport system component
MSKATWRWTRGFALAAVAASLVLPAAASAAVDDTILVSRANGGNGEGAESFAADVSISDNGCRMTFNTTADNIAFTDPTAGQNVVMRDSCAQSTESIALDEDTGDPADEFNSTATISGDGCRIAFWTTDSLHPDDPDLTETPNGFPATEGSVYVRDVCESRTYLASRDEDEDSVPVSQGQTSISQDGSRVAFATNAHVDVQGAIPDGNDAPGNVQRDVYIRDLDGGDPDTGSTILASVRWDGAAGANGDNLTQTEARQAMSDNGRFISMYTTSTDLIPPSAAPQDTNGREDIYVRDLQTGVAQRATLADDERQLTAGPGRVVTAFTWAISGNGRHIAWWGNSAELGGNGQVQVWRRDLDAGTTELISRASGPEGDIASAAARPALDNDGRFVAFASDSGNLATNVNGHQVFVRDTLNQTTHAISRKSGHLGELSTGASITEDIAFSDDGRFAAFASASPDLAPGDANGDDIDIFRRELNEPPAPRTQQAFNARPIISGAQVDLPGPGGMQPLGTIRQLPIGTVVDATQGRIAATTTGNTQSKPVQTAEFYGARFVVTQQRNTLTLMKLKRPTGCKKRKARKGAAAAAGPVARLSRGRRGLWGSGRGRFGTRGGRGAGTVRGTVWYVENRCNGSTLFRVAEGTVAVDDFGKKGKVNRILRAGGRYVAKAKKPRR